MNWRRFGTLTVPLWLALFSQGHSALSVGPAIPIRLVKLADLDQPTVLAAHPQDETLYVGEKTGRVRAIASTGSVRPEVILDLSEEVSSGYEQGLVGLVFAPDGRHLYAGITDLQGHSRVFEFAFDGRVAKHATRRQLLFLQQPQQFHNNGQILFGPDGNLYLGFGDGGPVRYEEHRSQDLSNLYGKILRIDPKPNGEHPYRIPPGNPFADRPGTRPEIWQYGLRQPWRFSFDRLTGDLWIGDVGEALVEEIDFLPAGEDGANFGWDALEGSHLRDSDPPEAHVLPIHEYIHSERRCVVIGGYVYRGRAVPELHGSYIFGDFCSGRLTALRRLPDGTISVVDLGVEADLISSFGEDNNGEVYVLSQGGGLFRIERAQNRILGSQDSSHRLSIFSARRGSGRTWKR